jgi:hypothetical protein
MDLRVHEIDIGFGELGFTFDLSRFNGDSLITDEGTYYISSNTGWSSGAFHIPSFEDGRNLFNLFYGKGAAENYRAIIQQPPGITFPSGELLEVRDFLRNSNGGVVLGSCHRLIGEMECIPYIAHHTDPGPNLKPAGF